MKTISDFQRKIKVLNERIWEGKATWPNVERWLRNFTGEILSEDEERLYSLHLLSHMMYFGDREMRALLKSVYRDTYKYPIIESIRKANNDTTDEALLRSSFDIELLSTRFLGIGNPSESGTHLLYSFRQENGLPKDLFINAHEIFTSTGGGKRALRTSNISRYVFLDDLAGSGTQAQEYSREILVDLKLMNAKARTAYYVLFATSSALSNIRANTLFDDVNCVYELDESFRCFSDQSRYFRSNDEFDPKISENISRNYGSKLIPQHPVGYKESQLLLAFHHNTPDNTLPIVWAVKASNPPWHPLFRRHDKLGL